MLGNKKSDAVETRPQITITFACVVFYFYRSFNRVMPVLCWPNQFKFIGILIVILPYRINYKFQSIDSSMFIKYSN